MKLSRPKPPYGPHPWGFNSNRPQFSRRSPSRTSSKRTFELDRLEPRIMLAADAILSGVTTGMEIGLTAVGDELKQLFAQNISDFDKLVPGVVEPRLFGDETRDVSPTFRDALSINVDVMTGTPVAPPAGDIDTLAKRFTTINNLPGDGDLRDEAALRIVDLNGDGQASLDEAFKVFFVGRLQNYLATTTITDQAAPSPDLTAVDVGIQVANFLTSSPSGTLFGVPTWLNDRVFLNIDSVTSTVKNGVLTWDADFALSLIQQDRFDLGYEADKLGIVLDPGTPPNANSSPFKVPVYSTLDIGSLLFGFTGAGDGAVVNNDFFFAAPDRPSDATDGVRIGINIGTPATPVSAALIGVNVGFLGAHTQSPSTVMLDMDVVGSAVDPSNIKAIGFELAQQGVPAPSGTIEATGNIDYASIAANGVQFSLKIGNDPSHLETELTLSGTYSATADVVTALNTLIGGSTLNGLITASDADTDNKISFTVVASDPSLLGFANEQLQSGSITAGSYSSLIGVGKSPTQIKFLLSVNNVWKLVTVNVTVDADGADNATGDATKDADNNAITIDSLVTDLQAALTAAFGAGVTAGKTGAVGSERLTISGAGWVEISKTLTVDTVERITLAELQAATQVFEVKKDANAKFEVNLKLKADSGLENTNDTAYQPEGTLKVNLNPFTDGAVTPFTVDTVPGTSTPVIRASYTLTDKDGKALRWLGDPALKPDLQTMLDFNVINVADILGTFSEIGTWFERLSASSLLQGFDLPFGDVTIGDLLNFKDMIVDSFLFDDGDDGVNGAVADVEKLLKKVVKDGQTRLVAAFGNAQQLETTLNSLGLGVNVDGTVFVDNLGRQNLTYRLEKSGTAFDLAPNSTVQSITVPLDFELNLDPIANFETSGQLVIDGKGTIGLTLGVILGNAVPALDNDTLLADLNSKTGVRLNTNLAVTSIGNLTPLVGRISADAKFAVTVLRGAVADPVYNVTLTKAATNNNTTLADLRDDLNLSLAAAGLENILEAVIEPVQSPTTSAAILLQLKSGAAANITRFQTEVASDDPAFTELGLRTQSASTVQIVGTTGPNGQPIAPNPGAVSFDVTVVRAGVASPASVVSIPASATSDNASLQSLVNDLNASLPAGIVASQSGGRLVLSAIDDDIDAFSITPNSALGFSLNDPTTIAGANEVLSAAGVVSLPTTLIGGVQLRGGAAPSDPFGRLAANVSFTLNGSTVNLSATDSQVNKSVDDLVRSINKKIETEAGLSALKGKVAALNDGGRIAFRSIHLDVLTITVAGLDAAGSAALGIANGDNNGPLAIRPSSSAPVSYGVSSDVNFTVTINGTAYNATLTRDNTILNRSLFDLAASLNNAINLALGGAAKNPLVATVQSGQIVIGLKTKAGSANLLDDPSDTTGAGGTKPSDVASFSITSSDAKFATELKLISAAGATNNATKADFIIYFRDGSTASVALDALDGGDVDTNQDQKLEGTMGALIAAIHAQAPNVEVTFNSDGTSLKLHDKTSGPNLFRVVGVNGSPAAAQLGILGSDTSSLNVGEVQAGSIVADGFIEGGKIATIDLRDRIYLKDAGASAELTVKTKGIVEAEATFGFAGIKLSSTADQELFKATAALPIIDAAITLRKMFADLGSASALRALVGEPTLTLAGDFSFNVSTYPDFSTLIPTGLNPSVKFKTNTLVVDLNDQLPPAGQLFPDLGFDLEFINFGELLKFEKISFENVVAALQAISQFLKQFETFDFLDDDIPVLGVSVNELIDLADQFQKAVNNFQKNPAGGIQTLAQKIQEALGLPNFTNDAAGDAARTAFFTGLGIDPATVPASVKQLIQFAIDGNVLRFDLRLPVGFNKALKVDLDLGNVQFFGQSLPVDIQGGANLATSGYLDARLSFGIDLTTPTKLLIYDQATGIYAGLKAGAQNAQFNAAIGPVGAFVKDGSIAVGLNAEVKIGDGAAAADVIDLTNPSAMLTYLGTLKATLGGSASATLPIYFPTDSEYLGDIKFNAGFALNLDANPDLVLVAPTYSLPDFSNINLATLNPLNNIPLMLDGLDFLLQGLQDIMDGEVFGVELPLIGNQLQGAANFIDDFRRDVLGPIRQLVDQAPELGTEIVQKLLYSLLGPGSAGVTLDFSSNPTLSNLFGANPTLKDFLGLPGEIVGLKLLRDYQTGSTALADISPADIVASNTGVTNFEWLFRLGQTYKPSVNVEFDLGVPALALDLDVGLDITIDWDLALGLGVGTADGAYIFIGNHRTTGTDDDDELKISLTVDLDKTSSLKGSLGFLQLEIEESDTPDPGLEKDGPGQLNTFVAAKFGVNLKNGSDAADQRLSFSELGSLKADVSIEAEAEVNLDLTARFNPALIPDAIQALLPEVTARFVLDWDTGNVLGGNFNFADSLKLLGFRDVNIDMGSFINDFLRPFVEKIAEVTEPLQPIIDVITEPIPVISDLAGQPISLVDIAGMTGYVDPSMIYAIADIISLVNTIAGGSYDKFLVPLGDFILLDRDAASSLLTGTQVTDPSYTVAKDPQFNEENLKATVQAAQGAVMAAFDSLLDSAPGAGSSSSKTLASSLNKNSTKNGGSSGFDFPLFEEPSKIFGLLLGKDIPIVTYDLAPFAMEFSYTQKFPVWDALFVRIGGSAGLKIDLAFGYDTFGVRQFADGGFSNPLDLLAGFYVSDTEKATGEGTDVPELILKGELFAGAELNLGFASAGAEGVIGLQVDFDLYDPDSDGKVRVDELLGNFLYELKYGSPLLAPLAIFDVTGQVYAQLRAFVEALFFEYSFNITPPITLVEFAVPFEREPFLATERGDGSLLLNIGPNAAQRLNGDTRDIGETIYVRSLSATEVEVWNGTTVKEGDAQRYKVNAAKGIFGYGGQGNDFIDLSLVAHGIVYTLEGGAGDDIIKGSQAGGSMKGDQGNDKLTGGDGIDYIYGGEGNDTIEGGKNHDYLFGDTGTVQALTDEAYDPNFDTNSTEEAFGERFRAFVGENDGDDVILGGDGDDVILGGGGSDRIEGGAGSDIVLGDGGSFDRKTVGPNPGLIRGADGRLEVNVRGVGGKDNIQGNAGNDFLFGGANDDLIDGGADNDEIEGGSGFDTIYGGSAADKIFGGADSDIIFGFRDPQGAFFLQAGDITDVAADGIDTIYGEEGNDFIRGNDAGDFLYGGAGSDILFGDKGDDKIYGEAGGDIMFGGADNDTLDGSDGADIIFGDDGLVVWYNFTANTATPNAAFDFIGSRIRYVDGDGDGRRDQIIGDSDKALRDAYKTSADALETSQDLIVTKTTPSDGSDTVIGGDGKDLIFGGGGALDKLFGDFDPTAGYSGPRPSGQDLIIGDGGRVEQHGRRNARAAAESGTNDGADQISGNDGADFIFGGGASDTIQGFHVSAANANPLAGVSDNDVILGDNGEIIFDTSDAKNRVKSIKTTAVAGDSGRSDTIDGDFGNDIIFGGLNGSSDVLTGDVGDDILIGDQGEIRFDLDGNLDTLDKIESYTDGLGGIDIISGNQGNDVLIGGTAGDTMSGDDGEDILLGDNARIELAGTTGRLLIQVAAMPAASAVDLITTTDTAETTGGADTMSGNAGKDILVGGVNNGGSDTLYGDAASPVNATDDDDILVGDNGFLDFTFGSNTDRMTLDLIRSTRDGLGGTDIISGNKGADVIVGGTGGDTIYGDNAAASGGNTDTGDIILGDNADIQTAGAFGAASQLKALGTGVETIKTTDTAESTGGVDTISGNAGADVILGGVAGDTIYGDAASPANALDGKDVILGDNGELDFANDLTLSLTAASDNLVTLDRITSYLDTLGGIDTISGNAGADTVMGGTAGDIIYGDNATASAGAADGADILLGDNGEILFVDPALDATNNGTDRILILGGAVASIKSRNDTNATGGADTISGNAGGDIALGGVYGDTIYGDRADVTTTNANDGDDILLGDNGALEWLSTGRLSEITGIVVATENPALAAGFAARDANLDTLDLITTEQKNSGGRDLIFGDNGRDVILGGTDADTLHGDSGDVDLILSTNGHDLMFGDHGRLYPQFKAPTANGVHSRNFFAIDILTGDGGEGDRMWGNEGDDIMLGQQGDDRMWGGTGDDDMIGGHNVSGGIDEMVAPAIVAKLGTLDVNDLMDGGGNNDAMAGDNAVIWRRNDDLSPRFRVLTGNGNTPIYTTDSDEIVTNVTGAMQSDPDDAVGRDIRLVDHADNTAPGLFGADVMAGGTESDTMFGQLGDDLMQGDGEISIASAGPISRTLAVTDSGINPDTDQTLYFNVVERDPASGPKDGDDYMEGNGGSDLMFGGLGQDDMIGGSSSLFGLTTEEMRPDVGDIMFGGSGVDVARNDAGDATTDATTKEIITNPTGHARDADFIMGDNANVYRIVTGITEVNDPQFDKFRTFNYDNYSTALKIVPRGMQQLDYTLGGADFAGGDYNAAGQAMPTGKPVDNGGADLIHGESGDDVIFGMTGSDVLYGEGQDDDIIGGYGNDWISGGTGQDGVLGDDGLILTSRNSTTGEPLYGIAGLLANDPQPKYANGNVLNEVISTPGQIQLATINVAGELKKTVDITMFSYDKNWLGLDDEYPNLMGKTPFADDIIFGGLGSDFLHGGSGDDAISGAEALTNAYVPTYDANGAAIGLLNLGYNGPTKDLLNPAAINPGDATKLVLNPGDVLAYNPEDLDGQHTNNRFRAGEFRLYDEYDPRRKILLTSTGELHKGTDAAPGTSFEFLLNFDRSEGVVRPAGTVPKATGQQTDSYPAVNDDGADAIFGDLGNDWIVGGTGRDNVYGGWGNDLLQVDDNLDTETSGSTALFDNESPDTHPTYEDRAYGGAGRDILIGNTGGDRLIDWVGEYNSYLVPYAPFGQASVSRTLQPFLPEFLYALSAGDGADPTRYRDAVSSGTPPAPTNNNPNPSRNGEPFGELGLVLQKDFAWGDQTGAPADPQAGNIPGGPRDVLRSASFTGNGQADGFAVDVGTWSLKGGRYEVAPSVADGDAVSVMYVDTYVPKYFEVLATINAAKPTGGFKSNAYLVFDYQSSTDFKFAGINVSTNKLEIGRRTEAGWIVDVQGVVTGGVKPDTDYNLFLAVNGSAVTLVVNNQVTLNHTFAPRVDVYGLSHAINEGMIGLGANDAKALIDNVVVQRIPPVMTFNRTIDFSSGPTSLFGTADFGSWSTVSGRYNGTATATTPAIDLLNLDVGANALLDLNTKLQTSGSGGFVFDYYGPSDFKFVTVAADTKQILIGHRTAKGWFIDATFNKSDLAANVDYTLGVTLKGTTVSVTLNGATVASHIFNGVITDGDFGLFSRTGLTSFDTVTIKTDDPNVG